MTIRMELSEGFTGFLEGHTHTVPTLAFYARTDGGRYPRKPAFTLVGEQPHDAGTTADLLHLLADMIEQKGDDWFEQIADDVARMKGDRP